MASKIYAIKSIKNIPTFRIANRMREMNLKTIINAWSGTQNRNWRCAKTKFSRIHNIKQFAHYLAWMELPFYVSGKVPVEQLAKKQIKVRMRHKWRICRTPYQKAVFCAREKNGILMATTKLSLFSFFFFRFPTGIYI